jgi:PhzF family phenazine biosynthesis protein
MAVRIIQVDAFTNRPFSGNPAAVCLLNGPAEASWMQHVAAEMNLSETAFVHPLEGRPGFGLRWFTPTVEVDLCGHATLATAHVLWEEAWLAPERRAEFETRSGRLIASRRGDWIELDFPVEPAVETIDDAAFLEHLSHGLGAPVVAAARNRMDLLVEMRDEATVRGLRPDIRAIASDPARGMIVTSRASTDGFDFVSRFFAPRVGVAEDPVCGSAHCFLGPYWAKIIGRDELTGHQVSSRSGVVKVRVGAERVSLIGQAVTVMVGELRQD